MTGRARNADSQRSEDPAKLIPFVAQQLRHQVTANVGGITAEQLALDSAEQSRQQTAARSQHHVTSRHQSGGLAWKCGSQANRKVNMTIAIEVTCQQSQASALSGQTAGAT